MIILFCIFSVGDSMLLSFRSDISPKIMKNLDDFH